MYPVAIVSTMEPIIIIIGAKIFFLQFSIHKPQIYWTTLGVFFNSAVRACECPLPLFLVVHK